MVAVSDITKNKISCILIYGVGKHAGTHNQLSSNMGQLKERELMAEPKIKTNGEKALLQKITITVVSILILLVGTIWGMTWVQTSKKAHTNEHKIIEVEKSQAVYTQKLETIDGNIKDIKSDMKEIKNMIRKNN